MDRYLITCLSDSPDFKKDTNKASDSAGFTRQNRMAITA